MIQKIEFYILWLILVIISNSCGSDEAPDSTEDTFGVMEIRFDNVVGEKSTGLLSDVGVTEYPYSTSIDQDFNITLLRYFVSKIQLTGPNGEFWEDEILVTADEVNGYYLVDESDILSQIILLEGIPSGSYHQIAFTIGVDQDGVEEGAAGGVLSQGSGATDQDMFWNWNAGYLALKLEGQAASSPGEAFGESIDVTNVFGMVYHIGGWNDPNNNQRITLDLDEITVSETLEPEAHIIMDVLKLFSAVATIDITQTNNIHSPQSGMDMASNIPGTFQIDHVHQ